MDRASIFEQGKTCSFCCNINQEDNSLKNYCYWSFNCNLYEKGIHESRVNLLNPENK